MIPQHGQIVGKQKRHTTINNNHWQKWLEIFDTMTQLHIFCIIHLQRSEDFFVLDHQTAGSGGGYVFTLLYSTILSVIKHSDTSWFSARFEQVCLVHEQCSTDVLKMYIAIHESCVFYAQLSNSHIITLCINQL